MELQHQIKKSVDKLEIFIPCPGLSEKEITVSFDKNEGELEIMGKPGKNDFSEVMDLEISGTIEISSKYRSDNISMEIDRGIAVITLGVSEDVKLLPEKK